MNRRAFLASTTAIGAGSTTLLMSGTANAASCATVYSPIKRQSSGPDERLHYPALAGEDPVPTDTTWPPGHVNRYL